MQNFKQKLHKISCFVLDVDGVLTNGNLFISSGGELARTMSIKDGYAIQLAVKKGYRLAIISGGRPAGVPERMERLGVKDVFMEVSDKEKVLSQFMQSGKLDAAAVLFMGDDLPDRKAMLRCGIAACPADAAWEIRELSHYISEFRGGEGCVRDVIEQAMRLHGKWE